MTCPSIGKTDLGVWPISIVHGGEAIKVGQ